MAILSIKRESTLTLATYLLPPIVDQITFRLFSSRVSFMPPREIAVISGFMSLIALAEDRRTSVLSSFVFLAYKIAMYYFFARTSTSTDSSKTREAQLAALEALIDLLVPQIEKHLSEEGIYRQSGNATTIREAIARFNKHQTLPKLTAADDLIGVLKAQLKAIDPPLLQPYHQQFKAAASTKDESMKRLRLIEACGTITTGKTILKKIIGHFNKVHLNREQNRMNSNNLAVCFTPSLFSGSLEDISILIPLLVILIENPTILSQKT